MRRSMKRFHAGSMDDSIQSAMREAYRCWLETDGVDLVSLANSLNIAAAKAISQTHEGAPCAVS